MPCPIPGMCSRQPDCHDRRCPGRPQLHQQDGGHSVHGGIAFPFEADDEPIASPEDAEGWAVWSQLFLAAIAVACTAGVALACLKS